MLASQDFAKPNDLSEGLSIQWRAVFRPQAISVQTQGVVGVPYEQRDTIPVMPTEYIAAEIQGGATFFAPLRPGLAPQRALPPTASL
jgi:hypothetical protein